MGARPVHILALCASFTCLAASACDSGGGEEKPKQEKKDEPKADAPDEKPEPAEKADPLAAELNLDLSGPKPPETSTALFAVDGALIPLACFNAEKKALAGGSDCGKLVAEGEEVFLWSEFGKELGKVGANKNALCEVANKPSSLSVPTVDGGRAFDFAIWPKSAHDSVTAIPVETTTGSGVALSEVEQKGVLDAISKLGVNVTKGDLQPKQRAEADVDGDGKNEVFMSAAITSPKNPDQHVFSGLFMAPGGNLGALVLLSRSKRETDLIHLRGITDLDGDGKSELWIGITFDGGSGDQVVQVEGSKVEPLAKWTCGA